MASQVCDSSPSTCRLLAHDLQQRRGHRVFRQARVLSPVNMSRSGIHLVVEGCPVHMPLLARREGRGGKHC